MDFFESDNLSALEAKEKAQWIAFAPLVFQAAKVLRDSGILKTVEESTGLTLNQIVEKLNLPRYGARVLLESGLGIGLLIFKEEKYFTTKTASFILHDKLSQVNMDFVHDVCYQGMFHLDQSIQSGKPEGLKVFGQWPTIYEGLSKLPEKVQESWFGFDHFYSDYAFPEVLPFVFENQPQNLLDIGGNTGKWAIQCLDYDPKVEVTIMDLPGQVEMARKEITQRGHGNRIHFFGTNLLDASLPFPKNFDAIWMSQFLDCFSDEQIISILTRCRETLSPGGSVYILEPFWDRQRFRASAFVLQQTSLYFTVMANGNSQMYHSGTFIDLVKDAGFKLVDEKGILGVSHTLLTCKPA